MALIVSADIKMECSDAEITVLFILLIINRKKRVFPFSREEYCYHSNKKCVCIEKILSFRKILLVLIDC